MNPDYPIYVVSKGRWESRLTVKALERIGVDYRIVVEPQEYDSYAEVVSENKILRLPFSNLGEGSIPARNWIWEHSTQNGFKRHWILDDNISGFRRMNHGKRLLVDDGSIFKSAEDFVDRYQNIALAGFQYTMLGIYGGPTNACKRPFIPNTRIYSCILILNRLPHRWRGKYNEDTDLSLRVLKNGWCTVLFNAFRCDKKRTMTMRGGNTDELYAKDGRLKMAQSLFQQHPDITKIKWKWGRWQHQVDYRGFKNNKLIRITP